MFDTLLIFLVFTNLLGTGMVILVLVWSLTLTHIRLSN